MRSARPAFVASARGLAPILVLLGVAVTPSAVLTIPLAPGVHEMNPVAAGYLAGGGPVGLLALKCAGLVFGSAMRRYVHAWMPRTARVLFSPVMVLPQEE
jgi:hypothetical protein